MTARTGLVGSIVLWLVSLAVCVPMLGDDHGRTSVWVDGGTLLGVDVAWHGDALAAPVVLLATSVGLLVQVFSTAYLEGDPRLGSYTQLVLLFTVAMVVVVLADDLLVLVVGWEVMGLCSYLLIGHHLELRAARRGAVVAFLTTRVGDVGLVLAALALGAHHGTYRIGALVERVAADPGPVDTGAGLLLLVAVLAKSAQLPFSAWLPDAMAGPTPVSALIHAATMVAAGVYLLARLEPLVVTSRAVATTLGLVAAATMLVAALFALVASDLKRVLAWSTVSQLAYMFAALAVGDRAAALGHLVAHGLFKALLFLAAGVVAHAVGSTALSAMGGLRGRLPVTAWTSLVGFAALAGVAPTSGFFTKDSILDAALHATDGDVVPTGVAWVVVVCGFATVAVTAAYAVRTWGLVFTGPPATATPVDAVRLEDRHTDEPWPMAGPVLVLAVAVLAYAVGQELHLATGLVTTAVVLLIGVPAALAVRRGRDPVDALGGAMVAALRTEGGVSPALDAAGRATDRLGGGVVAADRDVVDLYPRSVAAIARVGARLADRAVVGNVQTYATVLAAGVLVAVVLGAR